MKTKKLFSILALAMALSFVGATAAMADYCGSPTVATLWAGQSIDVGTVTVANDSEYIYVTYQTTGDWYLSEVQLYVLNYQPSERLTPGQAPYKSGTLTEPQQSYTFKVMISNLGYPVNCDVTSIWLQAHAAVVKLQGGTVVQSETAYGGDIVKPDQGSWYGNISYIVLCCAVPPQGCYEFKGETAWADGIRYVKKGNWATYTAYDGTAKTVTLYAGQTLKAGTVRFSAPNGGYVTIEITLEGDWIFAEVPENVKIQDYATAPSGNPSPGLFTWKGTASGKSFSIDVPQNNYYGVHADVGYWVEVECPIQ